LLDRNRFDPSISLPSGRIQALLEEADSDVLLLYDCCHPVTVPTSRRGGVTEVIAAYGYGHVTPEVDEQCFTKTLISTLINASEESPFSVGWLHAQILNKLKCWSPALTKRSGHVHEHQRHMAPVYSILSEIRPHRSIVLRPLPVQAPLHPDNELKSRNSPPVGTLSSTKRRLNFNLVWEDARRAWACFFRPKVPSGYRRIEWRCVSRP
jgi:hypothetical protein